MRRVVEAGRLQSLILWGPPGSGKTTIARLIAQRSSLAFEPLSAVFSRVADLRKVFERAKQRRAAGQGTCLFVDEIHRFNRAQQDGFLPYVEDGTVVLIGATTENPSFELNPALLSRAQVYVLNRLDDAAMEALLARAEALADRSFRSTPTPGRRLRAMADGDGRHLLNMAETLFDLDIRQPLDPTGLAETVQRRMPVYDKAQESHYNLISALHKSMRGSDCDAALYWLARMLAGGEDPLYVARRLVRFAYEDVGLADPQAAVQALAGWDTFTVWGRPKASLRWRRSSSIWRRRPNRTAATQALKGAMRNGAGHRVAGAAGPYSQRADAPDEGPGIRRRIRLRP